MKVLGVISTTAVFLLLGATVPAFAQEEHQEEGAKPAQHEEPAKPAAKQEQAKPQKQEEQAKPVKQEEAKPQKQEEQQRGGLQSRKKPNRRSRNRNSRRRLSKPKRKISSPQEAKAQPQKSHGQYARNGQKDSSGHVYNESHFGPNHHARFEATVGAVQRTPGVLLRRLLVLRRVVSSVVLPAGRVLRYGSRWAVVCSGIRQSFSDVPSQYRVVITRHRVLGGSLWGIARASVDHHRFVEIVDAVADDGRRRLSSLPGSCSGVTRAGISLRFAVVADSSSIKAAPRLRREYAPLESEGVVSGRLKASPPARSPIFANATGSTTPTNSFKIRCQCVSRFVLATSSHGTHQSPILHSAVSADLREQVGPPRLEADLQDRPFLPTNQTGVRFCESSGPVDHSLPVSKPM